MLVLYKVIKENKQIAIIQKWVINGCEKMERIKRISTKASKFLFK